MPKIRVNNVALAYEGFGKGVPVVLTPGGWFPRDTWSYVIAARLSARYQVLVWDRRNTGASDVAIGDAPSELHIWADDLHHLLHTLDLSPAFLGGASAGHMLSLLMAHRYPEDVKGLILVDTPTDDTDGDKPFIDATYFRLAAVAESQGMQAVIALSTQAWRRIPPEDYDWVLQWVADTISKNPGNRDRLLAMDPEQFAAVMRKWGSSWLSERWYLSELSDDQIRCISAPALIAHGFDELHPRHTAEQLYGLLPNAEWVEYTDRFTQEEIDRAQETSAQRDALRLPFIEAFLERVETDRLGATR